MAEFFPKIQKDFAVYKKFLKRKKQLESDTLLLVQETTKRRCLGNSKVDHGLPSGECKLEGSISIENQKRYSLRIFATHFGANPCFRFCSWGRSHVNRESGKGLPKRVIPTPHFHHVDKHGNMVAYLGKLTDPREGEKVRKDYQLGANLFCQESSLVSPNGKFVVVKLNTTELGLSIDDPLGSANFPT